MSQANSDDLFGDSGGALIEMPDDGDQDMMMPDNSPMESPPIPTLVRKQGFSIYTMMLILSFLFLVTATILFFVDAGKY